VNESIKRMLFCGVKYTDTAHSLAVAASLAHWGAVAHGRRPGRPARVVVLGK